MPPQVKKEPEVAKKSSNLFGAAQSKPQPTKDVKKDSTSPGKSKEPNVKVEKISPNRSPKKNQSAAKGSGKVQQGKGPGSIALFFGKSSGSNAPSKTHDKSVSDAASKVEKVNIKDESSESVKNEPTTVTSKRQLSNTSG